MNKYTYIYIHDILMNVVNRPFSIPREFFGIAGGGVGQTGQGGCKTSRAGAPNGNENGNAENMVGNDQRSDLGNARGIYLYEISYRITLYKYTYKYIHMYRYKIDRWIDR